MVILKPDAFLAELNNLYENMGSSSVTVVFKKYDGKTKPSPKKTKKKATEQPQPQPQLQPPPAPSANLCLVRAVFKKRKIRTCISIKEINKFQQQLSDVLKSNIHLKKIKKSKKSQPVA